MRRVELFMSGEISIIRESGVRRVSIGCISITVSVEKEKYPSVTVMSMWYSPPNMFPYGSKLIATKFPEESSLLPKDSPSIVTEAPKYHKLSDSIIAKHSLSSLSVYYSI